MAKRYRDSEVEKAKIARWFSRDGENLVYYDSEDRALPCTRSEQDTWLNKGYRYIDRHYSRVAYIIRIGFSLLIIGAICSVIFLPSQMFADAPATPLLAVFFAFMLIMSAILSQEAALKRKIGALRAEIEVRLRYRDQVDAPKPRVNSFRIITSTLILNFCGASYFFFFETDKDLPNKELIFLGGIAILWVLCGLVPKLDRAHIWQTGKWFR
jgi:hypothetical protein